MGRPGMWWCVLPRAGLPVPLVPPAARACGLSAAGQAGPVAAVGVDGRDVPGGHTVDVKVQATAMFTRGRSG